MRTYAPTRRAVVAGVAGAPALLPAAVSATELPDARLIELGRQFQTIVQALEDCGWSDDALLDALDAVESEVLRIQATTMEGLSVKARAACWALSGDLDVPAGSTTNVSMSLSIIRDLVRLFDPDLEKPGALSRLREEIRSGATPPTT